MSGPQTRSKTLSQCEAAWKAGIPLKVTADGFPILMKPSMNCEVQVQGTEDIAYVGFPQDIPKPALLENLRTFLTTVPRLSAEEFEAAPDGIYTWILASVDGSEPTFYASRTTAMVELGTVHYSIATAVGATTVHGAGEVWKHGDEFTFNFLSGTFMDKWPLPKECPLKMMQEYLKQRLKAIFAYLFRSKALKFREKEPTFISTRFLQLTTAELEGYIKAGFVVCIHDKTKKAECKSTKSACQKPMVRLEQEGMDGGRKRKTRKQRRVRRRTYRGGVTPEEVAESALRDPPPSGPLQQAMQRIRAVGPKTPAHALGPMSTMWSASTPASWERSPAPAAEAPLWTSPSRLSAAALEWAPPLPPGPPPAFAPPMRVATAPAAIGRSPLQAMFDRITKDLNLTPVQNDYMLRTYGDALRKGITISEEKLRLHMQQHLKSRRR